MSGDQHHAPGLPPVHDEAADTPMWVPLLGLAVLVLGALYLVVTSALGDDDSATPRAEIHAAE